MIRLARPRRHMKLAVVERQVINRDAQEPQEKKNTRHPDVRAREPLSFVEQKGNKTDSMRPKSVPASGEGAEKSSSPTLMSGNADPPENRPKRAG